jgi:hypothetical protein
MTLRKLGGALALLVLAALPVRAADPYTIKVVDKAAPPKEVQEPIRKLLGERCVQLLDAKGALQAELWFRKELPSKATEAQIKNGLTYREIAETTVIGAVRFAKPWSDYRKQKVPAGVYTLRLAYQPMDGDHMGTAPHPEFCLIAPAAEDKSADTMEAKALHELSAKATSSHPGVFLLFPGKGAKPEPKLVGKGDGHWMILFELDVNAGGKKAKLGFGLNLVGFSSQA